VAPLIEVLKSVPDARAQLLNPLTSVRNSNLVRESRGESHPLLPTAVGA